VATLLRLSGGAVTDIAAEPVTALDEKIWVAWLTVKGARVVADSRPDPENRETRDQAERYLDTLLDARRRATHGVAAPAG
jgi:anthranilate/para-aminobenzoate synthase component I